MGAMTDAPVQQVEPQATLTLPFGISLSTTETWLMAFAILAACAVAIVLGRWWYKSRKAEL